MAKDIVTKAEILGGEIDVRANFGQTVKVTVSPDPYMGDTEVTPSAETQVLVTKKKFVQEDITVYPAPTETLSTTSNGQFTPSSGKVGFSAVTVDVNPDLRPLSVSENGTYQPDGFDGYSDVTVDVEPALESLNVTENGLYLPESGVDGFDRVNVDVPIPTFSTEEKTVTENGVYLPSAGKDGISKVTVDVPMSDWSAPTLVYEGDFDAVTNAFSVTELPNGQPFSFDRVVVEWSNIQQGQNVDKRTYWRSDKPMSGYAEPLISDRGTAYRQNIRYGAVTDLVIEDDTYISVSSNTYNEDNPTSTTAGFVRKEHGGYDKITAYAWWSWNCPAGARIKITGYNRTA